MCVCVCVLLSFLFFLRLFSIPIWWKSWIQVWCPLFISSFVWFALNNLARIYAESARVKLKHSTYTYIKICVWMRIVQLYCVFLVLDSIVYKASQPASQQDRLVHINRITIIIIGITVKQRRCRRWWWQTKTKMNIKVKQFEQDVDVDVVVVLFFSTPFFSLRFSRFVLYFLFSTIFFRILSLVFPCVRVFTFLSLHISFGLNLAIVARGIS